MAVTERRSSFLVLTPVQSQRSVEELLRRGGIAVLRVVLYAILILVFLIPFIWMMFGSVRRESEIFQYLYPFGWHTFFPIEWTLEHYRDILGLSDAGRRSGLNFGRNLANTLIVSTAGMNFLRGSGASAQYSAATQTVASSADRIGARTAGNSPMRLRSSS